MIGIKYKMSLIHLARLGLVIGVLAQCFIPGLNAGAVPPGAPQPSATYEKSSGLGFTGPYNVTSTINAASPASLNGILLRVSRQGTFYFYLQTETTNTFTFKLYADRALRSTTIVLSLYDSSMKVIARSSAPSCSAGNKPCTATLFSSGRTKGAYTLKVELPISSTPYSAWLTASMSVNTGASFNKAWPWINRVTLYGQVPALTYSHYYKVKLVAGTKYTLKLWGSTGSNLNVYVYSQANTSRAIASGTASTYPETVIFTVPARDSYVYVRVENAQKTSSEYFLTHSP